jgi:GntR family transcriptional regulator/MocR family aminotransferase
LRISGEAAGLHVMAWLPSDSDEHAVGLRAGELSVGVHELHRNCMTESEWPPALLLGYALPTESEIVAGAELLARAVG